MAVIACAFSGVNLQWTIDTLDPPPRQETSHGVRASGECTTVSVLLKMNVFFDACHAPYCELGPTYPCWVSGFLVPIFVSKTVRRGCCWLLPPLLPLPLIHDSPSYYVLFVYVLRERPFVVAAWPSIGKMKGMHFTTDGTMASLASWE